MLPDQKSEPQDAVRLCPLVRLPNGCRVIQPLSSCLGCTNSAL
jgi:hypothetical protein